MVLTSQSSVHILELKLLNEEEDRAWMADTSGIRRIYVGGAELTSYDVYGGVMEVQRVHGGTIRMPYAPPRFQIPQDDGSRVSSVELDPSEEVVSKPQAPAKEQRNGWLEGSDGDPANPEGRDAKKRVEGILGAE